MPCAFIARHQGCCPPSASALPMYPPRIPYLSYCTPTSILELPPHCPPRCRALPLYPPRIPYLSYCTPTSILEHPPSASHPPHPGVGDKFLETTDPPYRTHLYFRSRHAPSTESRHRLVMKSRLEDDSTYLFKRSQTFPLKSNQTLL